MFIDFLTFTNISSVFLQIFKKGIQEFHKKQKNTIFFFSENIFQKFIKILFSKGFMLALKLYIFLLHHGEIIFLSSSKFLDVDNNLLKTN